MTRKERRELLFRRGRPFIRPLQITNGNDYSKDVKVLWVAQKAKPFKGLKADISAEDFADHLKKLEQLYVIEDKNPQFKDKGLIGVVTVFGDWLVEPHVDFLPWATPRNILASCVAFFQYVRHSRRIGACEVRCLGNAKNLFNSCRDYVPLKFVGTLPDGDPSGDVHIFSIRGKADGIHFGR